MLYQLAVAVGGVFLALGGWLLVEHWVRRVSPRLPGECDEAARAHGCHHCAMADVCTVEREDSDGDA
ncbi:MAG: hypothetical protein JXR94_04625 [Candidatus Hydrogenedentes bacterium]|nr:hypothetical protein [Candidatus Hydrogenedentota bacterium]